MKVNEEQPLMWHGAALPKDDALRRSAKQAALALAFVLVGPSLGQVQKYAGTWGLLLYALLVFGFWILAPRFLRGPGAIASERWAYGFAIVTGLGLLLLFLALYPLADSGIVGGGSDRDDALNLGVRELLQGRCPYHVRTYLGNPIAPLPGGLLFSLPFVLLGNSAYQNFFWLAIFFLLARRVLREARHALLLFWGLLAFSPVLLQQIVTGSDLPANSIVVLVFSWLVICAPGKWRPAAALLLGLGLAWRVSFLLLLPSLFALLWREVGGKVALGLLGLVVGTFGSVLLPFALHAPHGISPFLEQNKFARFDDIVPYASLLVPLAAGGYALACSHASADAIGFLRKSALVLAFPIVCGLILATLQAERLDLHLADYGVSFLFFGALPCWASFLRALSKRALIEPQSSTQ